MGKKELKDNELKNVNAGYIEKEDVIECPYCHIRNEKNMFNCVPIESGCSTEYEYTCPECKGVFKK